MPRSKRLTRDKLNAWMDDNNLSTPEASRLMRYNRRHIVRWRAGASIPEWVLPMMTYIARDLSNNAKRAILCRCGCGHKTSRNFLTGQFDLYLPGHSPIARLRPSHDAHRKYPLPQRLYPVRTNPPLQACPECEGLMLEGKFEKADGTCVAGQQCGLCGYQYLWG